MKPYRAVAEYYDAENQSHPALAHDVPFLLKSLGLKPRKVLELATGTGRVSIPLAQAGHRVTGVDFDPAMLALAGHKRDAVGLRERNLRLLQGDLRSLDLDQTFDAVLLVFNTFLLFTTTAEQDAVLKTVARHLKPKGVFWLDIFNPDLSLLAEPVLENLQPEIFHVPSMNRTVFRTTSIVNGIASQTQKVTFHYSWHTSHGQSKMSRRSFLLTYLFPRELRLLVERNGLQLLEMFGDYDRSDVKSDSPRLLVKCGRK